MEEIDRLTQFRLGLLITLLMRQLEVPRTIFLGDIAEAVGNILDREDYLEMVGSGFHAEEFMKGEQS